MESILWFQTYFINYLYVLIAVRQCSDGDQGYREASQWVAIFAGLRRICAKITVRCKNGMEHLALR